MCETQDSQITPPPEHQLFSVTQIAKDRDISRDRVIYAIEKGGVPYTTFYGNAKVYSVAQRKMIDAELDRIDAEKGGA